MEEPTPALYFSIFSVSLILSSLLAPLLRKLAFKFSVLDRPNQVHKTHQDDIPYLGGLAIVIPVSLLAVIGPLIIVEGSEYFLQVILLLAPAVVLAIVGLYDDVKNLNALSRFIAQTLLAILISLYLTELGYAVSITGTRSLDLLISIFWIVGITNAFNFFDNLDGGATGIMLIASLTLFILALWGNQYLISSLSLALVGTGLGFLWWNRNPARIYLGDSGALFIGFLLSVSLLQFEPTVDARFVSALIPVFILALPIMDTTVAVISRISTGISIFQGGRDHLSHRLISIGLSRRRTAYFLWTVALLYSLLTLVITKVTSDAALGFSLLGLLSMGLMVIWFLRINKDN